jgi:hypothetical protein
MFLRKGLAMERFLKRSGKVEGIGREAARKELLRFAASLPNVGSVRKKDFGMELVLGASESAMLAVPVKMTLADTPGGTLLEAEGDLARIRNVFQ